MIIESEWNGRSLAGVLLVIVVGLLFGWQLKSLLYPFPIPVNANLKDKEFAITEENINRQLDVVSASGPTSLSEDIPANVAEDSTSFDALDLKRSWTETELLNYLSQLSTEEFSNLLYSDQLNAIFSQSPEIYLGLLSGILDVNNSGLKRKLRELLQYQSARDSNHVAEKFMMDKIRAYDRAPEWLGILKGWMIEEKDSVMLLNDNLSAYSDEQQRSDAISVIASGNSLVGLSVDDANAIVDGVAPYLIAENENVRASAVSAVARYPFERKDKILHTALLDSSSKVRIAAMRVAAGAHIKPLEIQRAVVDIMLNNSASAIERITAHQILSIFPLNEEQYTAHYEFGVELQRVYLEERRAEYRESLQ